MRTGTNGWAPAALKDAAPRVFWTDRHDAPSSRPARHGDSTADLAIVGAGFTGLWAALQALEENPGLEVVLLEADQCAHGASSRNGGFCEPSLTHGLHNGMAHWPEEIETLLRLGHENLHGLHDTLTRHRIDAEFEMNGVLTLAVEPWQAAGLEELLADYERLGQTAELLDGAAARERVHSPTYLGALRDPEVALVHPARLAWGLAETVERLGATIHDHSRVESIEPHGTRLRVQTDAGRVDAERVLVATNAYGGPVRRQRRYVIPVYDHVLMTEPLSPGQQRDIGWEGREGLGDLGNQFHYYRLTADDRILWGGYDATYHFHNGVRPEHEQSEETHGKLAQHFFETFPQLEGLRFTHRWGGVIGTTSRFTATWGTEHDGRLAWAAGYTGLGVGATRFGARVALDLLAGNDTERTTLRMVSRKPFPFPPEPLRAAGVALTKRALIKADERGGRRGPWLRTLDRFGIGFDS